MLIINSKINDIKIKPTKKYSITNTLNSNNNNAMNIEIKLVNITNPSWFPVTLFIINIANLKIKKSAKPI